MDTVIIKGNTQKVALRIDEVVETSGVGRTMVYEAIKTGKLLARKNGKTTLVLVEDMNSWLKNLPLSR